MITTGSLASLVPQQARLRPDELAVVDIDRSWTWRELDIEIGRLAAALTSVEVESGERVGVHHHKSTAGFIAMHAAVRVGAVAVPLDPGSPTDRLVRACDALSIEVVLTHEPRAVATADIADAHQLRAVVGMSGDSGARHTISPNAVAGLDPIEPVETDTAAPAYIITTSGSTGEPKGIVHTHASALAYASLAVDAFELTSDDRVTDIAPNHFDQSTFALWAAPLVGATNVVIPEPYQRLPASLSQLVADQRVTVWYSVPFLLQQLVERGDIDNRDLSSIRLVQLGGEVISSSMLAEFFAVARRATVANVYGPAEVNQCSEHLLTKAPDPEIPIPIGRPSTGCSFRLVEPGSAVPAPAVESTGELWVASPAMMAGYADRSEAESNIVVDDGVRWYRTGDLVSVADDGTYVFHGRADNQVKVRGHRVELEWVESTLEDLDGVSSAVAAVRRTADGADVVVAGIVDPQVEIDVDALRMASASVLPPYAVPTLIVSLFGKFTTGSGKLNRRALREQLLGAVEEDEG